MTTIEIEQNLADSNNWDDKVNEQKTYNDPDERAYEEDGHFLSEGTESEDGHIRSSTCPCAPAPAEPDCGRSYWAHFPLGYLRVWDETPGLWTAEDHEQDIADAEIWLADEAAETETYDDLYQVVLAWDKPVAKHIDSPDCPCDPTIYCKDANYVYVMHAPWGLLIVWDERTEPAPSTLARLRLLPRGESQPDDPEGFDLQELDILHDPAGHWNIHPTPRNHIIFDMYKKQQSGH